MPFDRLIIVYGLSAINDAVRVVHDGRCIKAVLMPERQGEGRQSFDDGENGFSR